MGDLVLKGSTSGQITVTPTAVAGTNTLTLPARTGNIITSADTGTVTQAMLSTNVAGNGPAFSAYLGSNQSFSTSTWTKITINTKEFDTNTNYDATTNYRFTPTVAGYYMFTATVDLSASVSTSFQRMSFYKNGVIFKAGPFTTNSGGAVGVSALIQMNGTTDYVEAYGFAVGSTLAFGAGASSTYFQASLVRAG